MNRQTDERTVESIWKGARCKVEEEKVRLEERTQVDKKIPI